MTLTYHSYHRDRACLPKTGALEHPHLICDMSDVEALRKRISAGRPRALWNRLLANCEFYADPSSEHWVERKSDDRWQTQLHIRAAAELAFSDLITGERSRGELAARVLCDLLRPGNVERSCFFNPPARQSKRTGYPFGGQYHRDVPRCNMDMHLAMAYDLVASFMDEQQRRVVGQFIYERTQLAWDHRWRVPLGTNNRTPRCNMDHAADAMSLWGDRDDPIVAEYPAYAAPIVEDYLDEGFSADGASMEGMQYGGCLCYVMTFAHMLNRKRIAHGICDPRPMLNNLVLFYYLTRDPGDTAFAIAKCWPMLMMDDQMWLEIARFFDAPLARWWWRRRFDATCESPQMAGFEAHREQRQNLVMTMLFCDDDDPEQSPQQLGLPASHRFFKRGLVVARRDHEEDTPVFRLIAGPQAKYGTTQHWDAFAISLSAYGQRLIVDGGKSSNMSLTANHSSILINGKGQETLCGIRPRANMLPAKLDVDLDAGESCIRSQPAFIQWHERAGDLEYVMATAVHSRYGIVADGYGDCKTAERHALVVHEGATPFYVVTCDIFDYPDDVAWRQPLLEFVLIAAEDTTLTVDDTGATITGPKAALRAELVTTQNVTAVHDSLDNDGSPRLFWKRKGEHGRIMTVLTPFRDGIDVPAIECVVDDEHQNACVVRFGGHEDHITFLAPRENIETDQAHTLKTGMRLKVIRRHPDKDEAVFTIPTLPGPYVVK